MFTRARVQAVHLLEIVDPDRPGGSRVPVQRTVTVLGRVSMDVHELVVAHLFDVDADQVRSAASRRT